MTLIEHPRYDVFQRMELHFPPQNILYFMNGLKKRVKNEIKEFKNSLEYLNGNDWKDEITDIIEIYRKKLEEEEDLKMLLPFLFPMK